MDKICFEDSSKNFLKSLGHTMTIYGKDKELNWLKPKTETLNVFNTFKFALLGSSWVDLSAAKNTIFDQ